MKLSIVTTPNILAALLALTSCCCPYQAQEHGAMPKGPSGESLLAEGRADMGQRRMVLGVENPLNVPRHHQEGIYSCWSTCGEMIMEYVGGTRIRQCEQADPPFFGNPSICCDSFMSLTTDPSCDSPSLPEFPLWGFGCTHQYQSPLSPQSVIDEINAGRPFAFSWIKTTPASLTGGGGPGIPISHMMVVIGYSYASSVTLPNSVLTLHCLNPRAFGTTDDLLVPYSDYQGTSTASPVGSTVYLHEHDYFMITSPE